MLARFRFVTLVLPIFGTVFACGMRADALPLFAHEYGLSCQKCHTAIPALSAFGQAFLNNGYHLPGATPGSAAPISVKLNFQFTTAAAPDGLPRAVVDEIELLTGGTLGTRGSYFVEQYVVDGGQHGNLREAWIAERLTPEGSRIPVDVRVGQFTLALPVDPESFRESSNHYAVFDQMVGRNSFNFFDPKTGVSVRAGGFDRGTSVELSVLDGHDMQNGLPTIGADILAIVHQYAGRFDFSVYRYAGRRSVNSGATGMGTVSDADAFTRTGVGVRYEYGHWTSESILQENGDTNRDGFGTGIHTSAGFTQLRYAITPKLFALARYDGRNDDRGFLRTTTALLGYRLSHNSRFTIEDVIAPQPVNTHTLNAQLTVAY